MSPKTSANSDFIKCENCGLKNRPRPNCIKCGHPLVGKTPKSRDTESRSAPEPKSEPERRTESQSGHDYSPKSERSPDTKPGPKNNHESGQEHNHSPDGPMGTRRSFKKILLDLGTGIGLIILLFLIIGAAFYANGAYHNTKVYLYHLPDVWAMEDKGDIDGLINALNNSDWGVRKDAAVALGHLGEKSHSEYEYDRNQSRGITKAVDPLLVLVNDPERYGSEPDSEVRKQAIRSIGYIGDQKAVEPLKLLFNDKSPSIKGEAAFALGDIIGSDEAAKIFSPYIKNQEEAENLAALFHDWYREEDDGEYNTVMKALQLYVKRTGERVTYMV